MCFLNIYKDHQTFRQGEQIKVYIITWNTVTKNSIGTARKNLEPIFADATVIYVVQGYQRKR